MAKIRAHELYFLVYFPVENSRRISVRYFRINSKLQLDNHKWTISFAYKFLRKFKSSDLHNEGMRFQF